jgi:hypothetical protein
MEDRTITAYKIQAINIDLTEDVHDGFAGLWFYSNNGA